MWVSVTCLGLDWTEGHTDGSTAPACAAVAPQVNSRACGLQFPCQREDPSGVERLNATSSYRRGGVALQQTGNYGRALIIMPDHSCVTPSYQPDPPALDGNSRATPEDPDARLPLTAPARCRTSR